MNVEQLLKTKGLEATTVDPKMTIAATARLLTERNRGLALVCAADDTVLGVVSVIDISRAVGDFAADAAGMPVQDIMTVDFTFCRPGDSVERALLTMTERGIRHLPVVEDGTLKGLLNIRGVLEARFEEAELKAEELLKYVTGVGYH
ncbi:MAG: CBS domain-containing protein [Alphaproteobacteria bacterium]|jgi:CBS domain-containing protein|nr:CBS domain-containing protein [Alphaproteobacteria bacterium]